MGCCSLKDSEKRYSKLSFLLRLSFFTLLHNSFLSITLLKSLFCKRYKKVYRFYKQFYKKARKEIIQEQKSSYKSIS